MPRKSIKIRSARTARPTSSIPWPRRRSSPRSASTPDAILAALLHDCLEDTSSTHEEICTLFSPTVADLVEGVTKLTRVTYSTARTQQMENLRKMFLAMSKDIRVVLIKICDRLHNMRTMQYQTPDKQRTKSRETMDIYAPLAHRLGMQSSSGSWRTLASATSSPWATETITRLPGRPRGRVPPLHEPHPGHPDPPHGRTWASTAPSRAASSTSTPSTAR